MHNWSYAVVLSVLLIGIGCTVAQSADDDWPQSDIYIDEERGGSGDDVDDDFSGSGYGPDDEDDDEEEGSGGLFVSGFDPGSEPERPWGPPKQPKVTKKPRPKPKPGKSKDRGKLGRTRVEEDIDRGRDDFDEDNINSDIYEEEEDEEEVATTKSDMDSDPSGDGSTDSGPGSGIHQLGEKPENRDTSFFAQPGILTAVIGGAVVGLLCAILLVMFIVYRMRKKDEGSYALDEPKRSLMGTPYVKNVNKEFYA